MSDPSDTSLRAGAERQETSGRLEIPILQSVRECTEVVVVLLVDRLSRSDQLSRRCGCPFGRRQEVKRSCAHRQENSRLIECFRPRRSLRLRPFCILRKAKKLARRSIIAVLIQCASSRIYGAVDIATHLQQEACVIRAVAAAPSELSDSLLVKALHAVEVLTVPEQSEQGTSQAHPSDETRRLSTIPLNLTADAFTFAGYSGTPLYRYCGLPLPKNHYWRRPLGVSSSRRSRCTYQSSNRERCSRLRTYP